MAGTSGGRIEAERMLTQSVDDCQGRVHFGFQFCCGATKKTFKSWRDFRYNHDDRGYASCEDIWSRLQNSMARIQKNNDS